MKTIWDKLKSPPPSALKKIDKGRLKNFTDIKPQWRLKALTDAFGPCGQGWMIDICDIWQTQHVQDQELINVKINLFYRLDTGEWSEPIPGIGCSRLVAKEQSGPYVSDEAMKGALTDAISVAGKFLGLAADVYLGYWDGSKYNIPVDPRDLIDEIKDLRDKLISAGQVPSLEKFNSRVKAKYGADLNALPIQQLGEFRDVLVLLANEAEETDA